MILNFLVIKPHKEETINLIAAANEVCLLVIGFYMSIFFDSSQPLSNLRFYCKIDDDYL